MEGQGVSLVSGYGDRHAAFVADGLVPEGAGHAGGVPFTDDRLCATPGSERGRKLPTGFRHGRGLEAMGRASTPCRNRANGLSRWA